MYCCPLNKSKTMMRQVTVCCIIFVILLFAVKDGYNNLFAGNCTRYNRTYNTYGDGRWVSSLNNTKNCIQQFLCLFFFKKNLQFFVYFLAAYQFRKNSGHCSCVSQIGFVGTPSSQQTGLWHSSLISLDVF